jgi:hypothetical protein
VGGSATFSVVASGYGLTYQWYFNGASIPDATGSSYTRSNAQHTHAGQYHVVVANDIGEAKSAKATLTVNGPPLITLNPSSQTVAVGGNVTFSVAAIGGPPYNANEPFSYNWKKNGLWMDHFQRELTIDNVQSSHAGQYSAVV